MDLRFIRASRCYNFEEWILPSLSTKGYPGYPQVSKDVQVITKTLPPFCQCIIYTHSTSLNYHYCLWPPCSVLIQADLHQEIRRGQAPQRRAKRASFASAPVVTKYRPSTGAKASDVTAFGEWSAKDPSKRCVR